jgi:hypothetical protein
MYHSNSAVATLVDKGDIDVILNAHSFNGEILIINHESRWNRMKHEAIDAIFTPEYLQQLFPKNRANDFFEALLGDADEGAYDISLTYQGCNDSAIHLEMQLKERPGHCLACNLTQGLPTVFSRHPVINVKGVVEEIEKSLNGSARCTDWSLGYTQQKRNGLHAIPLTIKIS